MTRQPDGPYYALIASLPALPELDRAEATPINRIRLHARLGELSETDRADLERIESLLHWERLAQDTPDTAVVRAARAALPRLEARGLADLVRDRLELRTAIAALRRRRDGETRPAAAEAWGFGRYTDLIRRHWDRPDLGLGRVMPAIGEFERLLRAPDPNGLERALLHHVWRRLKRAGEGHYFDLRAVVIYVLRWNILDRWVSYQGAIATERLNLLCDEALEGIQLNMSEDHGGNR